jgi:hypothetical protein
MSAKYAISEDVPGDPPNRHLECGSANHDHIAGHRRLDSGELEIV